jgi:S1-C subfamily serine protease
MRAGAWWVGVAASAALMGSALAARAELAAPEPSPVAVTRTLPAASDADTPWFRAAYDHAVGSVVRVEVGASFGAGFVYASPRHIATAFHVVALGREIKVIFRDGRSASADVVATDPDHDLAILELTSPGGAPPLVASAERVGLGTPIVVIGHPRALPANLDGTYKGLLAWTPSHGMIVQQSDDFLQIDGALNPGDSGGPVLDRAGRVLGVASRGLGEGLHFAVPVARLQALACRVGQEGVYRGRWVREGTLGALLQASREGLLFGFDLGERWVYQDRWALDARLGLLWTVGSPDLPDPILTRSRWRSYLEASFGRRWLPMTQPFPVYLGVALGGAFAVDRVSETRAVLINDVKGGASLDIQRDSVLRPIAWPLLSLSAESGSASLAYGVLLDVKDPAASFQRVSLGFVY